MKTILVIFGTRPEAIKLAPVEMLEETSMIEVKQGPYAGENDKTRFSEGNCA